MVTSTLEVLWVSEPDLVNTVTVMTVIVMTVLVMVTTV